MDSSTILEKINSTPIPEVKKVALAYSGGLDSALAVPLLREIYKADEIVSITLDIGQGEEEIEDSQRKAEVLGIDPIMVDMREEQEIETKNLHSKCGWSAYEGFSAVFPKFTFLRGEVVVEDWEMTGEVGWGRMVEGQGKSFKIPIPKG